MVNKAAKDYGVLEHPLNFWLSILLQFWEGVQRGRSRWNIVCCIFWGSDLWWKTKELDYDNVLSIGKKKKWRQRVPKSSRPVFHHFGNSLGNEQAIINSFFPLFVFWDKVRLYRPGWQSTFTISFLLPFCVWVHMHVLYTCLCVYLPCSFKLLQFNLFGVYVWLCVSVSRPQGTCDYQRTISGVRFLFPPREAWWQNSDYRSWQPVCIHWAASLAPTFSFWDLMLTNFFPRLSGWWLWGVFLSLTLQMHAAAPSFLCECLCDWHFNNRTISVVPGLQLLFLLLQFLKCWDCRSMLP